MESSARQRSESWSKKMPVPLIGMPQGAEWLIILAIVVLVFGAAKLPELARGTGQALRIFKSETKGLRDDDDDKEPAKPAGELNAADESLPSEVAEGEIVDERERNA
jgi:sec-independent protein translocase protein TatA